jgi:hypothetical protein
MGMGMEMTSQQQPAAAKVVTSTTSSTEPSKMASTMASARGVVLPSLALGSIGEARGSFDLPSPMFEDSVARSSIGSIIQMHMPDVSGILDSELELLGIGLDATTIDEGDDDANIFDDLSLEFQ